VIPLYRIVFAVIRRVVGELNRSLVFLWHALLSPEVVTMLCSTEAVSEVEQPILGVPVDLASVTTFFERQLRDNR